MMVVREAFNNYLRRSGLEEKEYQHEGVAWCYKNETSLDLLVHGGFIVDEMGLGKTIVMIGLFVCHYLPRTLIVLPPVLIDQWFKQIQRTTGHSSIVFKKSKTTLEQLNSAHIVITTYGALVRDCLLHQVDWSRIVFDEAHHIRNEKTQVFQGAKKLKSPIRWLVSGTPIQNSKRDFYSLCSALNLKPAFYKNPANLRTIATCYMLRRTKVDVGIILPQLTINNHIIKWKDERERRLSNQIHASFHFSKGDKGEGEGEGEANEMSLLCRFIRAKQSCVLPRLVPFGNHVKSTSKMDYVVEMLIERKDNERGKLVFCHFREEIDEIARRLVHHLRVATFDGRNSHEERILILNSKLDVLILQIQTGCEGLNLQEHYSEIYFVSPHWNPAVEDQAIARCHRIGQTKTVDVFRFEMEGFNKEDDIGSPSIDNYVTSVQDNKRNVANVCLSGVIMEESEEEEIEVKKMKKKKKEKRRRITTEMMFLELEAEEVDDDEIDDDLEEEEL
jgi:SNF2 family DNA or RNA helicase